MKKLELKIQENKLTELSSGWEINKSYLVRKEQLGNFDDAVDLLNKVAGIANDYNHHPDVCIRNYNWIVIKLTTHDVGGLTDKDFELAERIDELLEER